MRISLPALRLASRACALAAALVLAPAARAQDMECWLPGGEPIESRPICEIEPRVDVTPPSVAVAQPGVPVRIEASDHYSGNNFASFRIELDGQNVTSQWNVVQADTGGTGTGRARKFSARGTVPLSAALAERTLFVELCDTVFCTAQTRTFTLLRPGVEVGEDGTAQVVPPAGTRTTLFTVRNTGLSSATFALTAECRDTQGQRVTPCSVAPTSQPLGAGASATVSATYPATQQGGTVTVMVRARQADAPGVEDAGWTDVDIRAPEGQTLADPAMTLVPLTAGATVERSRCVTVATALRGAFECGDLRVVHALPVHRTRGRAWAPALLYNGQHAHPRPTVYADVTVPAGSSAPASVEMVVTLAGGATHRATFDGTPFLPGQTRRVGVQWDALNTATGLYRYRAQVISHYPGGARASQPDSGEVAIVNRSGSGFGAGWWPAGVERLQCVDCPTGSRVLWIGGDGSTRVYEPVTPGGWTTWVAQSPDGGPDTLVLGGSTFTRKLPGGGRVHFDGNGLHTATVNRLGQTTRITHGADGPTGIYVPGSGAGGPGTGDPAWIMDWDNAAHRVRGISATAAGAPTRTTTLHIDAGGRTTAITDPDGGAVWLAYPESGTTRRMMGHRNRRGTWTYYGYDPAGKLASAITHMASEANLAPDLVTYFTAAESQGVAFAGATGAASTAAAQTYTRIDGPRTDVLDYTWLWLTSRGAVRRVRDALGAETNVQFGDARFPTLATRVVSHTGMVSTATYDQQGRVTSSTVTSAYGGAESTTTTTTWDHTCDRPTATRSPGADTVFAAYDPVTCNVLWQRLGRDAGRTVTYTYHPAGHAQAGQLESVLGPVDAQGRRALERVVYDARGNLRMTESPLGFRALYVRDALGRDSVVYTPLADSTARDTVLLKQHGVRQTVVYDVMDRVRETVSYGPMIEQYRAAPPGSPSVGPGTTPGEWLSVVTTYDGEGSPLTVTRSMSPNPAGLEPQVTQYAYDRAGRKTDEWTAGMMWSHFDYDPAGNVTSVTTPRLAQVTNRYDAAGRLVQRTVPAMRYGATGGSCGAAGYNPGEPTCNQAKFPYYPNEGTGYTIPEEWTTYRYDRAGKLAHAANADAIVRRTYFPNGQVRTDSSYVREVGGNDTFSRLSGIEYGYHEGRLTRMLHPRNLADAAALTDTFSYHPGTGELSWARDRLGNAFTFTNDNTGAQVRTTLPGGIVDTARYDLEGRLEWRRETSPFYTVPLQEETYLHDARNKLVAATVKPSVGRSTEATFWQWYSGLGNLVMTHWANTTDAQWQREAFTVDPLGNVVHRRSIVSESEGPGVDNPDFRYTFDAAVARVRRVELVDVTTADPTNQALDQTFTTYDASGNQETSYQRVYSDRQWRMTSDSRSYYGLDDRLRAVQKYETQLATVPKEMGLFEEYRYDPLGRRVAVRTRRPSALCNQSPQCFNSTTYFVWAGDQLLWETRQAESPAPHEAGGTVSYFQAGGIDRPLVIWKSGVGSVVTHQNWRGQFARGTWGAGHALIGRSSDCTATYTGQNCVPVPWPGWNTGAWFQEAAKPQTVGSERYWLGSLSVEMRDASGLMYKRNRYYNPQTGQFTQPDPIGLAGGLNTYGFAAGDPVGSWDPFGLCAFGIGRDAALGYCSETDAQHKPLLQDECSRDEHGACERYIPRKDWEAIGSQIRRLPNTPGKCGWIRSELLSMWRQGPEARHFWFWNGLDVMERNSQGSPIRWRVGQYVHDPARPYFEFERRVFMDSRTLLPHEGLHMYYHHYPEPTLTYKELHDRIYVEQAECRLR
jgi:RHS repeat-associated protein